MGRAMILLVLPLLMQAAGAQESVLATFRVTGDEEPHRGWIVAWNDETFTFQRFGSSRQERVRWDTLFAKDRKLLRRKCRLDGSGLEPGTVEGVRIHFRGGATTEGVLARIDADGNHWVRARGLLLSYPDDRIERVEKVVLQETDVFTERELYLRRLSSSPPSGAQGHRTLADFAFQVGDFKKAREHYRNALRLRPDWRPVLVERLAEIEELLKDEKLAKELGIVRRAMRLDRDYARAETRLKKLLERYPGRRSLIKARDELTAEKRAWNQKRFHAVKNQEFTRVVEAYLRGSPSIDEAMAWARNKMAQEVKAAVKRRMGLTEEDFRMFSETRPKYSPHYASYWSGTFVINRRAKKGSWSSKRIQGDPNRWWFTYNNVKTRGNFLRAYAAERNPKLFEVISIRLKACGKCGGSGRIKHVSLRGLKALDGGHEWYQTCPRCYGARNDRVVLYR